MSQTLTVVSGDDVVASTLQEIFAALAQPGIFNGFELSVGSGQRAISISPGAGVFDSGVFIFETETKTVDLSGVLGSNAQDFTILYTYQPSDVLGGTAAQLGYQLGLVDPDTLVGGLVLGWIRHQSGSAVLSPSEFIPARQIRVQIPIEKQPNTFTGTFAPFSTKWAQVSGAVLPVSEGYATTIGQNTYNAIISTISNNTNAIQSNVSFVLPILVPATGLGQLLVECEVPNTANINVSFIDTAGVTYHPTDSSWTFIAIGMSRQILSVPQSLTLASGQMAFIKLTMAFQPGSYVRIKTLGYSSYTEPF